MMLTLVRHGESESNKELHESKTPDAIIQTVANPQLTSTGRKQALETAAHLVNKLEPNQSIHIWTSELNRAIDTALPLCVALMCAHIQFEYKQLPDLNEKSEAVTGVKMSEPLHLFIERVRAFLPTLHQFSGGQLIIVGHSVFISVLTSLLINPNAKLDDLEYSNSNCAITRFRNGILECQGNVDHLSEANKTGLRRTH